MNDSFCRIVNHCNVCEKQGLVQVISLPNLPFTGIYCSKESNFPDFIYRGVNQALMACPYCGHAQLQSIIPPSCIYDHTYTHRGSASAIARKGNEFFADFLQSLLPNRVFKQILDIGEE